MKSILYVGATLMIGASIYGFVDFKRSSHKKEFKGMYTNEKPMLVSPGPVKDEPLSKQKEIAVNNASKKMISKKESSPTVEPVIKPINEDEQKIITVKDLDIKTGVDPTPSKENTVVTTVVKKRKFSTRLFSRAPLRDEVELVPVKEKTEKKSTSTRENKEQ
jgi:hypothetical protein